LIGKAADLCKAMYKNGEKSDMDALTYSYTRQNFADVMRRVNEDSLHLQATVRTILKRINQLIR